MWTENRWKEKLGKDWSLVSYGYGFKCIYDNFFRKTKNKIPKILLLCQVNKFHVKYFRSFVNTKYLWK